jgi:TRAP-type C4-dicarboxylate transport system permease large subunit
LYLAFVDYLKAGLAQVNVMAGIIFVVITGFSVADVAELGALEMNKCFYNWRNFVGDTSD